MNRMCSSLSASPSCRAASAETACRRNIPLSGRLNAKPALALPARGCYCDRRQCRCACGADFPRSTIGFSGPGPPPCQGADQARDQMRRWPDFPARRMRQQSGGHLMVCSPPRPRRGARCAPTLSESDRIPMRGHRDPAAPTPFLSRRKARAPCDQAAGGQPLCRRLWLLTKLRDAAPGMRCA